VARPPLAVIDASVAAKWFLQEPDTDHALALRDGHAAGRVLLTSPSIMPYEVANALRFHPAVGSELLAEHIEDLFILQVGIDPVSDESLSGAVRVAYRLGLTVYDACYIALAERLRCPLFTADEVQLEAAGRLGHHVSEAASYLP
jgi:predicted nucleic acid-binding protein